MKRLAVAWTLEEPKPGSRDSGSWWGGNLRFDVPDALKKHRLALGVLEVDGDDDLKVRSHVGTGGSTTPLSEFGRVAIEIDHAEVENSGEGRRLRWRLDRHSQRDGDDSKKKLGFEGNSWISVMGPIEVKRFSKLRTDRLLPLARVEGDVWNRDLLVVGMLLAPDDDYEGLSAKELRDHWLGAAE